MPVVHWAPDSYVKSWNQSCAAVINVYGNPIEFVMKKKGQLFSRRRVFRMNPRDAGILAADRPRIDGRAVAARRRTFEQVHLDLTLLRFIEVLHRAPEAE